VNYNAELFRRLAAGRPVSGAALGRELGISRTAIWKAIGRLRDLGVELEATPGRGYRLAAPVTPLDPAAIRAGLPAGVAARIGRLEVLAETDSSNARVLATDRPVGELVACIAEFQSAGRGRRGRRWLAPPGAGLCLSVGGRLPAAPGDFAALAPAAGLACAEALEALGVPGIGLKWPNDLMLAGGKLAGILVELRGESQGPATVAIGIGLNFRLGAAAREAIEAERGLPPADLAGAMPESPDRNQVAAALIGALAACLERAPEGLGARALARWRQRDVLRDTPVRIVDGVPGLRGVARGLDASGALWLETPDGRRHRVTSGEVSVRPAR
jgi:BirA family transcriptional regulator, biotin operon repressor / biotin---[acetyl-CoA-carboxylase] ligase